MDAHAKTTGFLTKNRARVEFKHSPDSNNHPALAQRLAEQTPHVADEYRDLFAAP